MTQNPDVSRDRSPAPGGGTHAARGPSNFREKAGPLLCLPVGLTTWAAFLYIGIRVRRRQFTMRRDGRDGVCQSRLVATTPSVSVIMSPPVPRLTSNLGKAEE